MPVISLSVESKLLSKFNRIIEKEGFKSKSEAFRVAMYDFVLKYLNVDDDENHHVEMIIGFSYVDTVSIRNVISNLQHEYSTEIKETLHRHLHKNMCFELVILHGKKYELNPLVNKIRGTRGIESMYVSSVAIDQE